MTKRIHLLGLCLLCLAGATVSGQADAQSRFQREQIKRYVVTLEVGRDATLTVTEAITVHARGASIRRGIFREVPTLYKGSYGQRINIGFTVLKVLRDGKPEPWHTRGRKNGKAIYIGDADKFLARGRDYTYTIVWRANRAIGFFEKHDELYWTAIGHGWRFPIREARVTVKLPAGATVLKTDGWTGRFGTRHGKDYRVSTDAPGQAVFTLTRPLRRNEGLTVFVSFPKGIVTPPGFSQHFWWFFDDNPGSLQAAIGLIVCAIYFLVAWFLVGRDPAKGTIIPRYHPPKGFTPAACRFVMEMDFDNKSFAAALISMAVKGYLRIEQLEGKEYKLHRLTEDTSGLSRGEKKIAGKLFAFGRDSIHMKQENHKTFSGAVSALEDSLTADYESAYFMRNAKWHMAGFGISAVTFLAAAFNLPGEGFWILVVAGVLLYVGAAFLIAGIDYFRLGNLLKAALLIGGVLGAAAVVALIYGASDGPEISLFTVAILACLAVIHTLFQIYIKAPTSDGRKVMDEIEGLKMYMSVAENERLNLLNPPERTPEHFERLLPYALALGVANRWSEQFAGVLAAASKDGAAYTPVWYHGQNWSSFNATSFGDSLGSELTAAVSSASTAPGSSSGGGGGGFSGGGGGGGGGGGW